MRKRNVSLLLMQNSTRDKVLVIGSLIAFSGVQTAQKKYNLGTKLVHTEDLDTYKGKKKDRGSPRSMFRHATLVSSGKRVALIENHKNINKKTV